MQRSQLRSLVFSTLKAVFVQERAVGHYHRALAHLLNYMA